ncbi:transposase [Gemmatimonadetes bacterium T265]|nr:transposase [Gemmatimonadetes bacterium T265]
MKRKRFTEEPIVAVLHEATAAGTTAREVARRHGVTETTRYRWRAKYGAMQQTEVRRLKQLASGEPEDENRRLTRLVADLSLDVAMRKDVAGRSW